MVFINKVEKLIKQFKECSRSEIGTALLAFEEYVCKNLDVSNDELKRLQKIFDYYDEVYSDSYPSLLNSPLESVDTLILEKFGYFIKDGYKIKFNIGESTDEFNTSISVAIINEKTGDIEKDFECIYSNEKLGYESDNYFDLVFLACQETRKQLNDKNIEEILKTYKI